MHLKKAELVDLAEGTRTESSAPHLARCARCRRQVREMRDMMAAAAVDADVPEPSPLFWDHLSSRVRQAVVAEATAPRSRWNDRPTWRRVLVPASAFAIASLLIAGSLMRGATAPPPNAAADARPDPSPAVVADGAATDPFGETTDDEDPLMLVADLSASMNLDPANDANLAPNVSAEYAVTDLNDDQLRELQRLLQQELAPSGV